MDAAAAATARRAHLRAVATQLSVFAILLVYAAVLAANARQWRDRDVFFIERDPSLSYPLRVSTLPEWVVTVVYSVIPFLSVLGTNLYRWRRAGRGVHSFPFPLNLSLLCPFPLNLSLHCPPHDPN